MDFPIPGSPPRSTTEPGTRPPPSTRSKPGRPVARRGRCSRPISPIDTACGDAAPGAARTAAARTSSTNEFHSPQSGQRPSHFGDAEPHDWQAKTVVAFAAIAQIAPV